MLQLLVGTNTNVLPDICTHHATRSKFKMRQQMRDIMNCNQKLEGKVQMIVGGATMVVSYIIAATTVVMFTACVFSDGNSVPRTACAFACVLIFNHLVISWLISYLIDY